MGRNQRPIHKHQSHHWSGSRALRHGLQSGEMASEPNDSMMPSGQAGAGTNPSPSYTHQVYFSAASTVCISRLGKMLAHRQGKNKGFGELLLKQYTLYLQHFHRSSCDMSIEYAVDERTFHTSLLTMLDPRKLLVASDECLLSRSSDFSGYFCGLCL